MEDNSMKFYFDSVQAKHERTVKRLIIALIVVTLLMFTSNIAWLYCWTQYDYESEETIVDVNSRSGPANYIGNNGDIYNGQSDSNKEKEN